MGGEQSTKEGVLRLASCVRRAPVLRVQPRSDQISLGACVCVCERVHWRAASACASASVVCFRVRELLHIRSLLPLLPGANCSSRHCFLPTLLAPQGSQYSITRHSVSLPLLANMSSSTDLSETNHTGEEHASLQDTPAESQPQRPQPPVSTKTSRTLSASTDGLVLFDLTNKVGGTLAFSPHCMKSIIDLKLLGVGYERQRLSFVQVRRDLEDRIGQGVTVPSLELSDGSHLTDSWKIAEVSPRAPRAEVDSLSLASD